VNTQRLTYILGALAAGLLIWWGVASALDAYHQHQGTQAETQAHILSGESNAHQTIAQSSDAKIPNLQAKVDNQAAALGRLTAERDALLRKLAAQVPTVPSGPDSASPIPTPASVPDVRDSVIAKDAEVIASQSKQIQDQQAVIVALTGSRDEWKATAELRERQALAQEAATNAWKSAVKESRWRGRIEGFAAGVAIGYAGGKL
jgi:hypothetical protein